MKDQETQMRVVEQQLADYGDQDKNFTGNQEVGFDQDEQETTQNGRLCIKLKIAKPDSVIDDNEEEKKNTTPVGNNNYPRVCEICEKGFRNGKALGGHMRMHYKALNLQKPKKAFNFKNRCNHHLGSALSKNSNFSSNNTTVGSNNGGCLKKMEISPVCCLCHKIFPSLKSLFGHMRSHPDRDWRGIHPPPSTAKNNSCSSTLSNSASPVFSQIKAVDHDHVKNNGSATADDHDLSDPSLPKWSVTGKRGSKGINIGPSSDLRPVLEDPSNEAVRDLMMLASANPRSYSDCSNHQQRPKTQEVRDEVTNSNSVISLSKKMIDVVNKTQMLDSIKKVEKGKGKAVIESADQFAAKKSPTLELGIVNNSDNDKESSESGELGLNSNMRKKRRTIKLEELEEAEQNVICQYKCTTCNKAFRTHQALGGHKSSHNKKQNKKSLLVAKSAVILEANESTEEEVHRCKICNKTFSSGWALGGHKKCHSSASGGVINEAAEPTIQTASPGEASQTGPRVVLNFDLNELPQDEDEDEEEEGIDSAYISMPENAASSNNSVTQLV